MARTDETDHDGPRLTTGRRILLSFGLLVLLSGVAAVVAAHSLGRVGNTLHEVSLRGQRVRSVLQLATAVRDQYAHQAHMILLRDDGHMPMYEDSRMRVGSLLTALGGLDPVIARIARSSARLDEILREDILPAVRAGDDAAARRAHGPALELVMQVQSMADELARRLETDIRRFEREAESTQQNFYWLTVLLLASATVFASVVGAYIGRSVALPVAALQTGAAQLAEGDLSARIELSRRDEFGRLADQFNQMTDALRTQRVEIVRSERLAGVGRLAAGVAHEINNPLGVILGFVRVLQKKSEGRDAEELQIIADEAGRCKEIVDGLLDLARPWQAGDAPVDLREVCETTIGRLQDAGLTKDVTIELRGEAMARGNERGLTQVLTNLLRNAIEATDGEGRVEVALEAGDAGVRIEVLDDGPGLDPARRDSLFQPFSTGKPTGTGLGLAVSDAIMRAHGGSIEADNRPEGGARFTVRLSEGGA